ncbi:succinate dehydrogenase [ubiquinone] cytochrome b small subunit, mitochondrial [Amyelois transitella]|uniref:succinate dehydrogenase [ubiquinone] cytochrome b small subunit, mitochondrial n=1 Tax=Amyelois transitella TaxID=680683 RepID=UPI002990289C|nr:succinate dehydrogenase [ubiquinone] cytochrome b small subunit, mitochondrial [Amyelois transitella]
MALSMFLRSPACASRLQQQCMRFSTQSLARSSTPLIVPLKNITLLEAKKSTPILNSVRDFRTSMVRMSEEKAHDHAKLWVVEKLTAAVLVPLIPLGLLMPNKLFDSVLAILITAHSFWGLEAIAVDYARASVVGPVLAKLAVILVYLVSIATLGGLFYVIGHDVGIAGTVRQLWSVKSENRA